MNCVRVYIATTEGPAEIQRLAEEDPDIRSVICLNGTSEALPVSPTYNDFVRKPTGIIERLFGHSAYRMDVSARISEGRSWQLGALAAHALDSSKQLAGKNDKPERAIWLTGEVDSELKIHKVDHVSEKLQQSSTLFAELKTQGIPITLMMAEENCQSLNASCNREQIPDIIPLDSASTLFKYLQLKIPLVNKKTSAPIAPAPQPTTPHRKNRAPLTISATLLIVATLAGAAIISNPDILNIESTLQQIKVTGKAAKDALRKVTSSNESTESRLTAKLYELHAPMDSNCAAIRFNNVQPIKSELHAASPGNYHSTQIEQLCGIQLVVRTTDNSQANIILSTKITSGDNHLMSSRLAHPVPEIQKGTEATWQIIFPRRLRRGFSYEWTAIGTTIGQSPKQESTTITAQHIGTM